VFYSGLYWGTENIFNSLDYIETKATLYTCSSPCAARQQQHKLIIMRYIIHYTDMTTDEPFCHRS